MTAGGQRVLPQSVGRPLVFKTAILAKTSSAVRLLACTVRQPRASPPPPPLPSRAPHPVVAQGSDPAVWSLRGPPL